MDIEVRDVGKYIEVKVKLDGATLETGLMDELEARALAKELANAASEILNSLP